MIEEEKGPQKFLEVIGTDRQGNRIFKYSDMLYPQYESEYEEIQEYVNNNVLKKYKINDNYQFDMNQKRKKLKTLHL